MTPVHEPTGHPTGAELFRAWVDHSPFTRQLEVEIVRLDADGADLLGGLLARDRPALLDVRWGVPGGPDLDGYLSGHIPGAAFVDLDAELAAAPGAGGRHPLPEAPAFQAAMRRAGVSDSRPVVV